DIDAGGDSFSLASTISGGNSAVILTTGSSAVPIDSSAAQQTLTAANAALKPAGCTLTPLLTPDHYPQGFLFSRPEPELGVKPDGSLAASSRGGLLVVCDVPKNPASDATQFSPERLQALFGFVYTSTIAHPDVGGFGIGDTAGPPGLPGIPSRAPSPALGAPSLAGPARIMVTPPAAVEAPAPVAAPS